MRLTAPRFPTFLVAILIEAVAVVDRFYKVPTVHAFVATHRFEMSVVAFVILMVGVVFAGL